MVITDNYSAITFTESMQGLTPHIELTIQGTQKEYPIVVLPFYTKKQKTRRQETKKIVSMMS